MPNPTADSISFISDSNKGNRLVIHAGLQNFSFVYTGLMPVQPADLAAALAGLKADLTAALATAPAAPATPPPAPPAPSIYPTPFVARGTVSIPAGTFGIVANVDQPQEIAGAGMRKTMLDGQRGVGAGHRLSWGKGVQHWAAPGTARDIGFINGGGGDGNSDAEAGVYAEGFSGALTLLRCAFDGNENGVFVPNKGLADVDLVIDGSVFGRNAPNGLDDGRSHDVYVSGKSVTIKGSVFVGTSKGNTIKCRGPKLDVSDSYVGRVNGRWIDCPGGTVATSARNVFVTTPGSNVQNAFGFYDEGDDSANPGQAGSFTSDGDTFYFSRFNEVIWINHPSAVVQFKNAKVFWIGAKGSNPPQVTIQGPGQLTGDNPFRFDESNRVDAAPPIPADPTA